MKPHPKQAAFLQDPRPRVLAYAGAQSGKTLAAAPKVVDRVLKDLRRLEGPLTYWVVDPTYDLARVPFRYLVSRFVQLGVPIEKGPRIKGSSDEPRAWLRVQGRATLWFKSAQHPEHLVSEGVHGLWVNEAARVPDGLWVTNLQARLIATKGWAIFDSTPTGENWVFHEIYKRGIHDPSHEDYDANLADPSFGAHQWRSADNPAVSQEEVERARRTLPPWAFKREWEGDPHHFLGQVFPHWLDAENVSEQEFPGEVQVWADFGFAPGHAGVFLVAVLDRNGRKAHVREEHYHEGLLADEWRDILEQIIAEHEPRAFIGDAAEPGILAYLRARRTGARHIDIMPSVKGAGSVNAGIFTLADLVGQRRFTVSRSCPNVIREMKGFRWRPSRVNDPSGAVTDVPLAKDDHAVAAIRYGVYPVLARRNELDDDARKRRDDRRRNSYRGAGL